MKRYKQWFLWIGMVGVVGTLISWCRATRREPTLFPTLSDGEYQTVELPARQRTFKTTLSWFGLPILPTYGRQDRVSQGNLRIGGPPWKVGTTPNLADFVPAGFRLVRVIQADLNGDGLREVVVGVENQEPNHSRDTGVLVMQQTPQGLRTVWSFSDPEYIYPQFGDCREEGRSVRSPCDFQVEDINNDGQVEIFFLLQSWGGSEGTVCFHMYGYHCGRFEDLLERPIEYNRQGGIRIQRLTSSMPGQQIIKWNYIYGNNEAHCGPHYYIGEFYGWKRGLYRLYRSVKTSKQCADDAEVLADLGVPLPRPNK